MNKRVSLFFLLFSGLLLLVSVSVASAQAGTTATVHTGKLNLRTGPGVAFPALLSVPNNTQVILLGRAQGTTWVQVQLASGQQGWMNSIHLLLSTSLDTLPVTYQGTIPTPQPQPQPNPGFYTVQKGDTLKSIAARFNTTWQILAAANNLINPNLIYPGMVLKIAYSVPAPAPQPQPQPQPNPGSYIVQKGDTLQSIAARFSTTWQTLALANNLANPNVIYAGMRLTIPAAPHWHVVQPGDTLFAIALRYNVSVAALIASNNLANANVIYVGQSLLVP